MARRNVFLLLALGGAVAVIATVVLAASLLITGESPRTPAANETPTTPEQPRFDVEGANARLAELLAEPEPVSGEFLSLLRRMQPEQVDPATRQQLVNLLLVSDLATRQRIGRAIGMLQGDEATARELLRLLESNEIDALTARIIFNSLGRMNVPGLLPDLLAMLEAGSRHEALLVPLIAAMDGIALVVRLTDSTRPQLRRTIANAIVKHPHPDVVLAVADSIPRADPATRKVLVEILGQTRDVRFVDELRNLYAKESDEEIRLKVLRALGRIGDPDAALFLLEQSNREGPEAAFAATALREVRRPDALEALAAKWDLLIPSVRFAVMESAARLPAPTPKLVATAGIAIYDTEERTRIEAARILGRPGANEHIGLLVDFLERNRGERAVAAGLDSLLCIGSPGAAEAIVANLHLVAGDAREIYRVRAERILSRESD